jgi:phosphodiesterase/alkaline phosphatase D-like protein
VPVLWDVALDPAFTRMVRRGRALALAERDHTVKVDVLGLPSNAVLYFRFVAAGATSPVGRTRTLPVGAVSSVRLAVFSCSNYPAGYFHAYAEAARLGDIDVAVHLGDYIYADGLSSPLCAVPFGCGPSGGACCNSVYLRMGRSRDRERYVASGCGEPRSGD